MANRWVLEDGSGFWQLEDASGYWLLDNRPTLYSLTDFQAVVVEASGISVTDRTLPWGAIK